MDCLESSWLWGEKSRFKVISFLVPVILNDDTRQLSTVILYPRFPTLLEGFNYVDASGMSGQLVNVYCPLCYPKCEG